MTKIKVKWGIFAKVVEPKEDTAQAALDAIEKAIALAEQRVEVNMSSVAIVELERYINNGNSSTKVCHVIHTAKS